MARGFDSSKLPSAVQEERAWVAVERVACVRIAVPTNKPNRPCATGYLRGTILSKPGRFARTRPCRVDTRGGEARTYKIANLRGLTRKTGVNMRPMQVANMAKAARSRPPNTSNRSHRLTGGIGQRRWT